MNPSTWMNDTTAIHDLPLRRICLPTTHDCGTYQLTNPMVGAPGLPPELVPVYNNLPKLAQHFEGIYYEKIGDVLAATTIAVGAGIFEAVKGLATSTTSSIGQQLAAGIRGLDLRIAKSDDAFYTYHGLRGTPLSDVLSEIASFLQQPGGEILYVTFGHYEGFRAGTSSETTLLQQIDSALGAFAFAPQLDGSTITNDVFNETWQQIVTLSGTSAQASRVVLVNGESSAASGNFWPMSYSPPDSTNQGMAIYGAYTNTTDLNTMLQGQTANFAAAQSAQLPFALYMTLTPSGTDYTEVIVNDIAEQIEVLGGQLQAEYRGIVKILGEILEGIGEKLEIRVPVKSGFRTLAELAGDVDGQLDAYVQQYFAPAPGQPNAVSMIYLDFYETTNVVDLAITLSCSGT